MDEMLGYPSSDPHGDPIPDNRGAMKPTAPQSQSLADAARGNYRLIRVDDSDTPLLDWLGRHFLRPGCEFTVSERDPVCITPSTGISPLPHNHPPRDFVEQRCKTTFRISLQLCPPVLIHG